MSLVVFIIVLICLIGFSALCSGLNVALMALDLGDLKRKARLGNPYAITVLPLRQNSNLSLTAILLANIAAVSATSLVLGERFNGWIAGIATTILIVIFGEIMPQVYILRRALRATAKLVPLLRLMILCTYPLARPLQLLLDHLFGKHTPRKLQTRQELGLLISEHIDNATSELDDDEIEIMKGALQLSEKRVRDIMTPIARVYCLEPDQIIDGAKIDAIKAANYSRLPVFNPAKTVCYGTILMKDMVDMDFDEKPERVKNLKLYPVETVGSKTALDTLFRKLIVGGAHLAPVESNDQIVGIVTIEDLIEEIVGREIEDEADRYRKSDQAVEV